VNVSVMVRHMELTEAMRRHAEEKVSKLPRYYDGLQSVEVTFDMEAGQSAVEIVAAGKRKSVFVAHHRGDDMYATFDQCMHKLEEQLRRHKDRVRDHQVPPHDQTLVPEAPEE
jgi:putative sigma-54 modulation protein